MSFVRIPSVKEIFGRAGRAIPIDSKKRPRKEPNVAKRKHTTVQTVCTFDNDYDRIHARIDGFPIVRVIDVEHLRITEVRKMLRSMGESLEDETNGTDMRALLRARFNVQCPICLELHNAGDELTRLPCGHGIHKECVHLCAQNDFKLLQTDAKEGGRSAFALQPRCPVCRSPMYQPS